MAVVAFPAGSPPALTRVSRSALFGGLVLLLVSGLAGVGYLTVREYAAYYPLYAETAALGEGGVVQDAAAHDVVPGTRVLAGTPDTDRLVAEERAWLAAGSVPTAAGVDPAMVTAALLDLRVLSRTYGVPVAGWSPAWRYVWPRDAALAAAALARTGHDADADRVVTFLGAVQPDRGAFAARYRADTRAEPDARGVQLDGTGWALWALDQVAEALPPSEQVPFVRRHRELLDRSTAAAGSAIGTRNGLPPVSSDYWERREWRRTLATAALLTAGLQSAARLYGVLGDDLRRDQASVTATRLRTVVLARFGPAGFPRYLGGRAASADLGVGFLLPPFADQADPAVAAAWRESGSAMARPAGGLAPGGSWRRDGVSWTNVTATYALVAAALGDREQALAGLDWLNRHRTRAGSYPEKVLADGRPAMVAPLAWTAAAVLLTAEELSG